MKFSDLHNFHIHLVPSPMCCLKCVACLICCCRPTASHISMNCMVSSLSGLFICILKSPLLYVLHICSHSVIFEIHYSVPLCMAYASDFIWGMSMYRHLPYISVIYIYLFFGLCFRLVSSPYPYPSPGFSELCSQMHDIYDGICLLALNGVVVVERGSTAYPFPFNSVHKDTICM